MSRRDSSRVHIAVRQNDTLLEFENFKKKFLFANKQITKQNCSLSMKIEELNAHISTLYVENLRLRASEIALQSQLKREKVKSHKIMADAEAAVLDLLKHFGIIRESYNVPTERPHSPREQTDSPLSTRCRRPPPRSPTAPRLAQLPAVPDIDEEPEPHETSSEENEPELQFPTERLDSLVSSRRRTSMSRLPIPSRVSTPPPGSSASSLDDGATSSSTTGRKRKLTRRASGIISPNEQAPRPISPVLGSPMQQDIDLSVEEEAAAMQDVEDIAARGEEKEQEILKKPRKKTKARNGSESDAIERRERKKAKETKNRDVSSAPRLKDVTNSPRRRRAAAAGASATDSTNENKVEHKEELPSSGKPSLAISPPLKLPSEEDMSYLPTPLPSSAANTPIATRFSLPSSDGDPNAGGRERRARKSVNYAEPKLNTKMRKPDSIPPPGARPSLPSMSLTNGTAVPPSSSSSSSSNHNQIRSSAGGSSPDLEEDEVALSMHQSSSSLPSSLKAQASSVGRRSTSSSSFVSASSSATKRKRFAHVRTPSDEGMATDERDDDDDTDDGGEADSEFSEFRAWANVNTRRKSVLSGSAHDVEESFGRRHSLAV